MTDTSPAAEQPRETGQAAPHGPHSPSGAPEGAATPERAAHARTGVRVFWLQRDRDISGVSGTGTVADGVEWPDGSVTIRWRGERPSTVNWDSIEHAEAVHGHGGATRIVMVDSPDSGPDSTVDSQDSPPGHDPLTSTDTARTGRDNALDDALREQYAAAIRDAACSGDCGETEEECSRTRIQPFVWHRGRLDEVSGAPEMFVDAVLAVRDRRMAQLAAGRQTWRTQALEMERDRDQAEEATRRILDQRQELAAERYAWQERGDRAEAERDAAYRERAHLLAWLAALHPANAVITPAPDVDEPGWQLLYLLVGGWQMSWHIAPRDAELFAHVERVTADDPRAQWDGHSTTEKYDRIQQHVQRLTTDRP
ncbi:hypothetical protein [Streptomyces cucumeris]|uniref:hypothetical protein n=1 Tax=Streptomyces cucumeris TaxID=2962890 RepID=UPI0020C85525|nr:hypothetical protein [Streptomyces sp. NEAU-Y11]MCP9205531.1 hypothetical protein [Streptomyces sp. NEAU-Y11]